MQAGYEKFIANGNPESFKKFLAQADVHCLRLAAGLAAHAHSINLIYDLTTKWGNQLNSPQYFEMLDCLKTIYGTDEISAFMPQREGASGSMIKPIHT